eukprot:COSAG01_NODE_7_length_54400_cov_1218.054935_37_plen_332_part_00
MIWANPFYLLLLLTLPLFILWHKKWQKRPRILFSKSQKLKSINQKKSPLKTLRRYLPYLILALILIALARPQSVLKNKEIQSEGIHIMLALDVSGSMAAEDLKPLRLDAAKTTIQSFISKRKHDQIGLIIFGSSAYTQCPLTLDYDLLSTLTAQVNIGDAGQETAIGTAIATALNRLKNSTAKSKIIILLTDGENNKGQITPINAANLAQTLGIKVYTIGVGQKGGAPIPYNDPKLGKQYYRDPYGRIVLTRLDEATLKEIASLTKAQYFRAENNEELKQIYNQIDALEKTKIKTKIYNKYKDHYPPILLLILILFVLESLLKIRDTKQLP